jgi:hypothetical protein
LPKENTHIFLANSIIDEILCERTKSLLLANLEAFCFGSIVVDTFFYSSNPEIAEISHRLHGRDGEKTNELTFDLLDLARSNGSESTLCVALGHISHCVFDMIFHPMIYYLVGNYYDDDPSKRKSAVYRHRLLETGLDMEINREHNLHDIFDVDNRTAHVTLEILASRYGVDKEELVKAYRKQVRSNRCFKSRFFHRLIYVLHKLKIIDFHTILPLFYGHLEKDSVEWDQVVEYRDIIDGESRRHSLSDLFQSARDEAIKRISTAILYYEGKIDRDAAEWTMTGESLDTGKVGCSVREINHTK